MSGDAGRERGAPLLIDRFEDAVSDGATCGRSFGHLSGPKVDDVQLGLRRTVEGALHDPRNQVDASTVVPSCVCAPEGNGLRALAVDRDGEPCVAPVSDEANLFQGNRPEEEERIGIPLTRRRQVVDEGGQGLERSYADGRLQVDGEERLSQFALSSES